MTVITAHTDGTVADGRAGWGLVFPGQPARHLAGTVNTDDVTVAEMWAVRMALQYTPRGTALHVMTDAQGLPDLFRRHRQEAAVWMRHDLKNLSAKILVRAEQRDVTFTCSWSPRGTPAQETAHKLAARGRERGIQLGEHWSARLDPGAFEVWFATPRTVQGWVAQLNDRANKKVTGQLLDLLPAGSTVPLAVYGAAAEVRRELLEAAAARGLTLRES